MDPINQAAKGVLPIIVTLLSKLDPEAWELLAPHEGKIFSFEINQIAKLYLKVQQPGVRVLSDLEAEEFEQTGKLDASFSGPLSAFLDMMLNQDKSGKANINELHIKGDMDLAKAIYDTWHHVDIIWEKHLSDLFGDTAATSILGAAQKGKSIIGDILNRRKQDVSTFLQQEAKLLPTKVEMDDFFTKVDTIKHDTERLAARINLLSSQLNEGN